MEDLSLYVSSTLKKQAQNVKEQHIPFASDVDVPNAETIAAMEEVEEMAKKGVRGFSSVEEMFKELGIGD